MSPRNKTPSKPKPPSFRAFCSWLNVTLTPGQDVLTAIAFDGLEPSQAKPEIAPLVKRVFGGTQRIPKTARGVVNAVCGARSGKTYVLIALRLIWGALIRDLSSLAPGEEAQSAIVAPRMKEARQSMNFIRGALQSRPELRAMIERDTVEEITIRRPDGARVVFCIKAAGRAGDSLRGKWFTDVAFDEAAFFRDEETGIVNDIDLYRAASPRVLPGGQIIIASTPWAEAGLLYDFHRENFGHPKTAIAAHAPTLTMNDSAVNRDNIERERLKDPDNAHREFDAQFLGAGTSQFFENASIDGSIDTDLDCLIARKPLSGEHVTVGADFGFRSDSSALVVVHRSADGKNYWVADVLEQRPEEGKPLKPSHVVATFAARVKQHGRCQYVMADQHYRETIAEHLADEELGFLDAPGGSHNVDPFVRARLLFREGRVHLPDNPRLKAQLKSVIGKAIPGGGMRIVQPRLAKGGHGDIVSALVLALYQAGGIEIPEAQPEPGTEAWGQKEMRDMLATDLEKHEKRQSAQWWEEIL